MLHMVCRMLVSLMKESLAGAELFGRAVSLEPNSQKGYFYYAKYLDKLMQDAQKRQAARRASSKGMDRIGGKARQALHDIRTTKQTC